MLHFFLERFHAPAQRIVILRAQTAQPHGAQLGFHAAVGRAAHAVERFADHAAPCEQRGGGQPVAQLLQGLDRVGRRDERGHVGLARFDQQRVADQAEHLVIDRGEVAALVVVFVQQADRRGEVARLERLGQPHAVALSEHAERGGDRLLVHRAGRRRAVEHGERVAHRAVGQTGDQPRRALGQLDALARCHVEQAARDVLRADAAEIEPLAARQDGRGHLVQLGRRQDKQHMLGRLLERFEQRVERADREHVHLVDDEHALFDLRGRVARLVAQVADVVHAVVRGRVDLGHVEHRAV